MPDLSPIQQQTLEILCEGGPLTCTELGRQLWPDGRHDVNHQCYARPASKVLKSLENLDLVFKRSVRGRRAPVWSAYAKD